MYIWFKQSNHLVLFFIRKYFGQQGAGSYCFKIILPIGVKFVFTNMELLEDSFCIILFIRGFLVFLFCLNFFCLRLDLLKRVFLHKSMRSFIYEYSVVYVRNATLIVRTVDGRYKVHNNGK